MINDTLKEQIIWYDTDQTIAKDEISNYETYISFMYNGRIKQINKDIYIDDRLYDNNIDTTKIAEQLFADLQIKKKSYIRMVVKSIANANLEITGNNMTDSCIEKEQTILENIMNDVDEDDNIRKSDWELYKEWRSNEAIWNINNNGERTGLADCFENIVGFIENFPNTKGRIKFNKIRNIVEYNGRQVVDGDYHTFINYITKYFIPTFSKIKMVKDAVDNIGNKNKYNPWTNYFNSLEYVDEGVDYIDYTIKEVLCCEEQEKYYDLYYETLKIMFTGIMTRIYNKEKGIATKYDSVVTFCGENGGSGKTTFFERLFDLDENGNSYCYVVAGDSFQPRDKDFLERTHQCVCLLIDELTMRRSVVTSIKGYITQRDDRFRKSYGFNSEAHMRGFIITATSNNTDILKDYTTDNERRWLIIKISENIKNYINVNRAFDEGYRDKLWAFIKHLYETDEVKLYLDDDRLLQLESEIQRDYKASNNADYNTIINDLLEREYGFVEKDLIDVNYICKQYLHGDTNDWCHRHNEEMSYKLEQAKKNNYILTPNDKLIRYYGKINRIKKKDLFDILNKLGFEYTKVSLNAEMRYCEKWNGWKRGNNVCRIQGHVVNAYWRIDESEIKKFEYRKPVPEQEDLPF